MKKYKYILKEKLYSIDEDIDLIYNKMFKKFIDKLDNKEINLKEFDKFLKHPILGVINSKDFVSKDGKEANKLNPIDIACGVSSTTSRYSPFENYVVTLTLNGDIIRRLIQNDYKWDNFFIKNANPKLKQEFMIIFDKHTIKVMIAHELSHWIDDTKHGRFILKRILTVKEINDNKLLGDKEKDQLIKKIMSQGKAHTYMVDTEVNSIIHSIKVLKANKKKEWDKMTLEDLFIKTQIYELAWDIYEKVGKEGYNIWQKQIVTRLSREGLLGKNMKNFVVFESLRRHRDDLKKLMYY